MMVNTGFKSLNVQGYPFKPPTVKFLVEVYHPNIDATGNICIGMLKSDAWKPTMFIVDVLNEIVALLKSPNPDDPLDADIAKLYQNDKAKFNKTAAEWTKKHAK